MAIDRINDSQAPAIVLLTGLVAGVPYEASIRALDLDQLAEIASKQPGRQAQLGPVRVTILSTGPVPASA